MVIGLKQRDACVYISGKLQGFDFFNSLCDSTFYLLYYIQSASLYHFTDHGFFLTNKMSLESEVKQKLKN